MATQHRVAAIALALIVAIVISACGSSKPTTQQQPAAAPAQQAAASENAPSETAKEFTPGKYKLSQITASSSNVVVALFGAARVDTPSKIGQYADRDALAQNETGFHPYGFLKKIIRDSDEGSWLLLGSLRHLLNGNFVSPGEAEQDVNYSVTAILVSPPCPAGTGASCIGLWPIELQLYKTSSNAWRSGGWKIGALSFGERERWHLELFERRLEKTGNEPFKLLQPLE